jgi:hypothetical protein
MKTAKTNQNQDEQEDKPSRWATFFDVLTDALVWTLIWSWLTD